MPLEWQCYVGQSPCNVGWRAPRTMVAGPPLAARAVEEEEDVCCGIIKPTTIKPFV